MLSTFFEALMLFCFGAAWPVSIYKSYVSRTSAGKSLFFLYIVLVGYMAGIAHKLMSDFNAVFYLYLVNAALVIVDIALYYRNERLARQKYGRRRSDAQSDKADKGR